MLGTTAQGMVNLWTTCTSPNGLSSPTCTKIRTVFDFFSLNYLDTCGLPPPLPSTPTMMTQVYGWAEFPNCPKGIALVNTPGYSTAIADFCSLQYNYLINTKPTNLFNPYYEAYKSIQSLHALDSWNPQLERVRILYRRQSGV
jgi:hypothetical protein